MSKLKMIKKGVKIGTGVALAYSLIEAVCLLSAARMLGCFVPLAMGYESYDELMIELREDVKKPEYTPVQKLRVKAICNVSEIFYKQHFRES